MPSKHGPKVQAFYKSKAWTDCRNAFYSARRGICERCGMPGKIVHHKTELNEMNVDDPSISLGFDNLELLCEACHNKEHFSSPKEPSHHDVTFGADGSVTIK